MVAQTFFATFLLSLVNTTVSNQPTTATFISGRKIVRKVPLLVKKTKADDESERLQKVLQQQQRKEHENIWYLQEDSPESLPFECTSCGRCCQTKGSVYMNPSEIEKAADLLEVPRADFVEGYASQILSNKENGVNDKEAWIRLRNNEQEHCIFLDPATSLCTIYEARPVQCSTYPFWTNIMKSRNAWNDEVRIPDSSQPSWTIPYWSAQEGGCEGMQWISSPSIAASFTEQETDDSSGSNSEAEGVPAYEAHQRLLEYQRSERQFPYGSLRRS